MNPIAVYNNNNNNTPFGWLLSPNPSYLHINPNGRYQVWLVFSAFHGKSRIMELLTTALTIRWPTRRGYYILQYTTFYRVSITYRQPIHPGGFHFSIFLSLMYNFKFKSSTPNCNFLVFLYAYLSEHIWNDVFIIFS